MLFVLINTVKNIFPVSQKLCLCYNKIPCVFPVWKKVRTKFPVFPVPWPPCNNATLCISQKHYWVGKEGDGPEG